MYRVITTYRDARARRPIIERGPWHSTHESASIWAELLRDCGYVTRIESQHGGAVPANEHDNNALADALASMA